MTRFMSAGLTCHGLEFSRRGTERPVLEAFEADFPCGQIAWISGPTGAGKSTCLHLLAGLLHPSRGEIRADGQPVSRWLSAHRDRWRRQVGIVFQHHRLVSDLTVLENVMLPLIPRSRPLHDLRQRARDILERVELTDVAGRRAASISGGERQRAAVARALVAAPRYVLADEPFAHQDDAHARVLLALLGDTANDGSAVVIAAHGASIPPTGAIDRRWQLDRGRIQEVTCPSTPC